MRRVPIPTYQAIMLPLPQLASGGAAHHVKVVVEELAAHFQLSADERAQLQPKGKQLLFSNRVQWALTYLKHSGLLEATGRARFRITPRGEDVLRERPLALDNAYLSRFPEFVAFVSSGTGRSSRQPASGGSMTPPAPFAAPGETPPPSVALPAEP